MENASKALIMAGGVLIAIMVLGALILMFTNLSNYQDTNIEIDREAQILEFNNQYETYNRDDVRGSELYSLLNRIVDYNRRKSEVATGDDEGKDFKFQPMAIEVTFPSESIMKQKWAYNNEIRLFNKSGLLNNGKLKIDDTKTSTTFKNKIEGILSNIEKNYGGKSGISNLASGISNLYPGDDASEDKKQTALELYNKNKGTSTEIIKNYESLQSSTTIKSDVETYYEYIQFKRAYFKCTGTKYNDKTGRIIEIKFEYNQNKID